MFCVKAPQFVIILQSLTTIGVEVKDREAYTMLQNPPTSTAICLHNGLTPSHTMLQHTVIARAISILVDFSNGFVDIESDIAIISV